MRESAGGPSPGRYLPVSTPCASGDHTICPMPFAAQNGNTSSSGPRKSSEYCGCDETNFTTPSGTRSSAAWICAGVQFEKPTYRALPASTTSVSARIVSSSGVCAVVAMALVEVDEVVRSRASDASSCLCTCARESPRSVSDIGKKSFVASTYESRGRDASTSPRNSSAAPCA